MNAWRKFNRLSGGERSVALEAAGALLATWLGLRLLGFRHWKNFLARLLPAKIASPGRAHSDIAVSARRISQLEMAAALNIPLRTNCLEQSLVLWWLLERRGIAAELRIGARKDAGHLEAHAWVELDGQVLNEPAEEHLHFVPFDGPIASWETQ
ncbi:MAG TPA: lasso peptide biosynthesis B2 protein [Candidatus Limnocylindrales bacterium]|nr:lasso peptide biosynthesis B2 protein [Candidatus Limnocylindrales bacterium]